MRKFCDSIRNNKVETSASWDKDGNLLLSKSGDAHSVNFTAKEIVKMQNAAVSVHNHPGGNEPFSPDDVNFAGTIHAGEIVVVSQDMRFSLKPADGKTWPADPGHYPQGDINYKYMVGIQGIQNSPRADTYNLQIELATRKSESAGRAEYDRIARQVWKDNAPKLGLIYKEEKI